MLEKEVIKMVIIRLNGNHNRICKEFFPDCNICSNFSICFPDNGLYDELSELKLLEQLENGNLDHILKKQNTI